MNLLFVNYYQIEMTSFLLHAVSWPANHVQTGSRRRWPGGDSHLPTSHRWKSHASRNVFQYSRGRCQTIPDLRSPDVLNNFLGKL